MGKSPSRAGKGPVREEPAVKSQPGRRGQPGPMRANPMLPGRQDLHRQERQARVPRSLPRQSPRPHHRRDRHRQDGDAAGRWPRASRAPACRSSPPTSRATCRASPRSGEPKRRPRRRAPRRSASTTTRTPRRPAMFWDLFGKQGHPIRDHRRGHGPVAAVAPAGAQRGAGRRAQHRLPRRRRGGAAAARSRATCGRSSTTSRARAKRAARPSTATSAPATDRRHPAPPCSCSSSRAPTISSASPRSTSRISCAPPPTAAAIVNILAADKLMEKPRLYATFLLWMLTELSQTLPEVGDPPKPKLVFFFDEAHLLFDDAPTGAARAASSRSRAWSARRASASTSSRRIPLDVPDTVSAQLGNRIQHALRAFTPQEQKAVKAAAETFRPNPEARHRARHPASCRSARRSSPCSRTRASRRSCSARSSARPRDASAPSPMPSGAHSLLRARSTVSTSRRRTPRVRRRFLARRGPGGSGDGPADANASGGIGGSIGDWLGTVFGPTKGPTGRHAPGDGTNVRSRAAADIRAYGSLRDPRRDHESAERPLTLSGD